MKVLMFNHAFFYISETFIYKQVTSMPHDIDIELLGFEIVNEEFFPVANKKYGIKRTVNFIDRTLMVIQKRILGMRYSFSVLTSIAVRKIMRQSDFDLVHAHFGFNALLIYPVAKLLKVPLVITFHGMDASPQLTTKRDYKKGLRKMLDYASAIIIVSPHMRDTLNLGGHLHKTHVIPCGVNPDEFVRDEHQDQNDTITILHSGRLVSKKGVPDLIRVFAILSHRFPNIRLNVIGEGPELALCKLGAEDSREGSIHFLGARPHDEVRRYMSEADIFVLNSREGDNGDMEGVPVSLLEAMSMRLAVVSTLHAGIPYAITNEVDGILVNESDNIALSAALTRLITNEQLRVQLGESARRTVVNKFTLKETVQKIADVYRATVSSKVQQ